MTPDRFCNIFEVTYSHITQIAAQDIAIGEKISCYVKRIIPITAEAQKVTGISGNGTDMTVKG